ncbi:MAG TPA: iron-sulfur cluster assembly scaffold protein [Deltaproteobacteria bacterium]|nr:iron-sulfur cluster assembly scaffold protein [Deltaproteobacteria bacterium]
MQDWKDLYRQSQADETTGPILFYNDTVLDHFTNPRNVGEMEPGERVGFALVGDPTCGDQMKLWIRVEDDIITDIKFRSFGCPGAIATSSMATELAKGLSLEEARELTDDDVITALGGIPEHKKHCSLLGITAMQAAIQDYLLKQMMAEAEDTDDDLP